MRVSVLAFALVLWLVAAPSPVPRAAAAACGASGTPTTTVYLPNITKTLGGPNGWVTPFIVQNVGTAATTLEVSFYRFSDGSLVTCRSVPGLLPGTSLADVPNNDPDLPDDSQFSVVVRSFGSQVVSVVNEHQGTGDRAEALSYVGPTQGATKVALPYVAKAVGGWTTTFVIQDLGSADATVTAAFSSADGTRTATLTRRIGSGRSQSVDPTVESALVAGTDYSVLLTSDQPIAAIVNAHNDVPTVARPMGFSYNGVAVAGGDPTYLPYVARNTDGIGRTTRVIVQNAGTADATPTLAFRSATGEQVTIAAPTAVKPGRSWSFDPRFRADGVTACPATASAGCVPEGEHGLVVSSGTFAVLGTTLSPATAMGYTGAKPAPSRVYLPNVTRTLGGSKGWTTPIIVQSAGATSASMRWYRFDTGTFATTQTITGLSRGASVRVDPKTISTLADNTQYSVVLDANGPVTAVVLELNSEGGDGMMAYEGFASTITVSPPVATMITVSPGTATVAAGTTLQFTTAVTDQYGAALTGLTVTWSVSSQTLGTVSTSGLFTAGQLSASGTVIASAGSITGSAAVTVRVSLGFEGLDGAGVPDVQVAVGPSHVVEEAGSDLAIFDKTGKLLSRRSIASLFAGLHYTGDNSVLYDLDSARFYLVGFSLQPSLLLVAVSASSDPTGEWQTWKFPSDRPLDYQHIGVSHDKFAVMIKATEQGGRFELHVFRKSDLTAAAASPQRQVIVTTSYLNPAEMLTRSDDLLLTSGNKLWTLSGIPGASLALTSVPVSGAFYGSGDPNVQQPGGRSLWVGGSGRPVWANGVLWHASDSLCQWSGESVQRHCAHFDSVTTDDPARLVQSFNVGSAGSDYFLPVVQVDRHGNVAAVFGRSSATEPASLYYARRLASDPPNTIRGPFLLRAGNGPFHCNCGDDRDRWGDYYGGALDPVDLTSMWFAGEYAKVAAPPCGGCGKAEQWGTYVARLEAAQ